MKCSICKNKVAPQPNGWAQGHNADPVVPNGRCCEACNSAVVIPARMLTIGRICKTIVPRNPRHVDND